MSGRDLFNFRDVLAELGVPSSNETNWKAGHLLRAFAANEGVEPARILTEKTDPQASVAAPHCIAHYPMRLFPAAVAHLRESFEAEARQGRLPL